MQLLRLSWLALSLLFAAPADARSVADATGRTVQVPDRIERVMPAGQPAAVLLYTIAPEKMVGWPHSPGPAANVTREQVYAWNPDIVVTNNPEFWKARKEQDWASLPAVAQGRVYLAPALPFGWIDEPPSVNRLLGLLWAGHTLYPAVYPEDLRRKPAISTAGSTGSSSTTSNSKRCRSRGDRKNHMRIPVKFAALVAR